MPKTDVTTDLITTLKVKVAAGEDAAEVAERLARKASDASDAVWELLSNETQKWVNSAAEAIENNVAIPLPSGLEELLGGDTEGGEEEEEVVKSNGKAKKAAKAAPKVQAKAASVAKSKKTAGARGRKGRFELGARIEVLTDGNPYREGSKSHAWFEKYKSNYTVGDALEVGTTRRHLRWAVDNKYLKIA